jgi:outer membrane protein assembly factor BamE (lipoprotein component of BamABCDE complex)
METQFRQSLKVGLISLGLLAGVFFLWAFWFGEGHGASLSKLALVHTGMTRSDVVAILGEPATINRTSGGSESWFYTRGTFCQVKIYLDENGKVEGTDHDH